jgi:hypothetical protein
MASLVSIFVVGFFCFSIFHQTRQLPASASAPRIGQRAPEFCPKCRVPCAIKRDTDTPSSPILRRKWADTGASHTGPLWFIIARESGICPRDPP